MSNGVAVVGDMSVSDEDKVELDKEISILVKGLDDKTLRKELTTFGDDIQGNNGKSYNLLKTKFAAMISANPKRAELENSLSDMQIAIKGMDPERVGKLGFLQKLLAKNPLAKKLQKIADGYESAEKQISTIEKALKSGMEYLKGDNNELISLYQDVNTQQGNLDKHLYVLKGVVDEIRTRSESDANLPVDEKTFGSYMIMKYQDLVTMHHVNDQFKTSIDMTVNNNTRLLQSVHRVGSVIGNLARTGLAIQSALIQQEKVGQVVQQTQKYASDLLVSNATMVQSNVKKTKEMLNSPVLQLDKVKESYEILRSAVTELEEAQESVTKEAIASLDVLEEVSSGMKSLASRSTTSMLAGEGAEKVAMLR